MTTSQSRYAERPYYQWFSDRLDDALEIARALSVIVNEPNEFSTVEMAAISIAPSSLSIASSIRPLVAEGYTPSARLLLRPLLERTATLDCVVNDKAGQILWQDGWKKAKRPSLSKLLSRMDISTDLDPAAFQNLIVNDLNAIIHPDPQGLFRLQSPTTNGMDVHWLEKHPEDFDAADTVCSAAAMCAVLISSNLKRAFYNKIKNVGMSAAN